jgi:putative solute:sodium symporter small subunit
VEPDNQAKLLLKHYQDTFNHLLYYWKVRNRLFVFILVVLALMALDSCSPGVLPNLLNAYLVKKANVLGQPYCGFDFAAIGSLIWFILLCLVIQYYQRSIQVDRQYRYLDNLERQLCDIMGGPFITREGRAYLSRKGVYDPPAEAGAVPHDKKDQRPLLLRAVGPVYTQVFPILLSLFVAFKLKMEGFPPTGLSGGFNFFICLALILFNCLYLVWVWRKR